MIVGNAPVELAGVASGLQSTAMPALSSTQLAGVKSLATVGVAPVQKGVPAQLEALMANVTHSAFISGMSASFLAASAVAVAGALVALLVRRGQDRTHGH